MTSSLFEGSIDFRENLVEDYDSKFQSSKVLQSGNLEYEYFPIVLRGSDIPQLIGLWDNNIRVAFYNEVWHLESFQIDERDINQSDLVKFGGFIATEPNHPHYINDTSDSTNALGQDDEFVFYARNGSKVSKELWWDPLYQNRIELEIHEPSGVGNGIGWMYIYYDTQDHERWKENEAYHDYITWSGKTNDWYTIETDWYLSSRQDSNPNLQDILRITSPKNKFGEDIMKEGFKIYFDALVEFINPITDQIREGNWNGTYYDEIVDNIGYGGIPTQQNSADGVACIDGPVRVIYFIRYYYSYTVMGMTIFELTVDSWIAVYLCGSSSPPIQMTNQMGPVQYIEQISAASFENIEGLKLVDENGRFGIIDGNPHNDEFVQNLNSPSHWGFYYGPSGSLWVAYPYDTFVSHGSAVYFYWDDTGIWHRGESGLFTRINPGNSTWWIEPVWTFIGSAINSDIIAQEKAKDYNTLYQNWVETGSFYQLIRDLQPLNFTNSETLPLTPLITPSNFIIWTPIIVISLLVVVGLIWRKYRASYREED